MRAGFLTHTGIFFLKILAWLPFPVIYLLSDLMYLVIYYLIGYRKHVVFQNLKNSFPCKTEKEVKKIARAFFRHFCDLTLETVKFIGMKEEDFRKRYIINGIDKPNTFFAKGKSIVVLTMHYNNWEWGSFLPSQTDFTVLAVYKRLHNRAFDDFINGIRAKHGAELTEISMVLRRIFTAENSKERIAIWLAADQTPPHYHDTWYTFLNQEAIFYPGPAVLSKRFDYPIFFQKTEKTGRGRYKVSFELLIENPGQFTEDEIVNLYIRKMEEVIHDNPEHYLWSHKRWKHERPAGIPLR